MNLVELSKTQYISLETFRKNGDGVKTPVWVAGEDDKLYVWTQADAWKTKRIRNNSQVNVAKCDMRGNLEGEWVSAMARVLDSESEEKIMRKRLAKKYGLYFRIFQLIGRLRTGGGAQTVIEISAA